MSASEAPRRPRTPARDTSASWPLIDRIGLALCWAAGLMLIVLAGTIVLFFAYKGITELRPSLLYERPTGDPDQSKAGGFLDPIVGTLMLTAIGTAIAVPIAVSVAIWLVEYGRPAPLARAVESGVEIIAGTPSIVLALFGLTIFSNSAFAFLSQSPEGTGAFGRSILISGVVMSIVALPMIVGATREALTTVPAHVREASYALGKTKAATVRRVLLPSIRPGIATGTALGMGRIIGDTAIVVILAGATLQLEGSGSGIPLLQSLQGTGSTLTTYVYENSPAGEGNAPAKAYAAAAVLLVLVVAMNYVAARIARGGREVQQWSR